MDPRRFSNQSLYSQPSFDPSVHSMSSIDPSDTEFDPSSDEDDDRNSINFRDSPDGVPAFSPPTRFSGGRMEMPSFGDQKGLMDRIRKAESTLRERDVNIERLRTEIRYHEEDKKTLER
jgi:hypothetical protein